MSPQALAQAQFSSRPAAIGAVSVLIVEDDTTLNELLCRQLEQRGYQVSTCFDGASALEMMTQGSFSLMLLDWMLPEVDGLSVLQQVRREHDTPVIMLTACGTESERISGLQCGADDYLTKPFNITELMLRIEGLLRRSGNTVAPAAPVMECLGLQLQPARQQVSWQGHDLDLTPTEYGLLARLVETRGEVLSKPLLYQELMGRPWSRYDRSLDMHVSKLRKKLTAMGFDASQLQTVHGRGYRLR